MKHKHAEAIIAWANGEEIQFQADNGEWHDVAGAPLWHDSHQYRVKPAAPKWPESTLSPIYLGGEFTKVQAGRDTSCKVIADMALAHALETGQVVLPDPARDMRIAKAVHYACNSAVAQNSVKIEDLAGIIAKVRHD